MTVSLNHDDGLVPYAKHYLYYVQQFPTSCEVFSIRVPLEQTTEPHRSHRVGLARSIPYEVYEACATVRMSPPLWPQHDLVHQARPVRWTVTQARPVRWTQTSQTVHTLIRYTWKVIEPFRLWDPRDRAPIEACKGNHPSGSHGRSDT